MKLPLYQIDAFTDQIFQGNPACVVPLDAWLPDETLLKMAQENAVAETAFFVRTADAIHLRWFTPDIEMDLCGHATLACAHALKTILQYPGDHIQFQTLSGLLSVHITEDLYTLNFPSRPPVASTLPANIQQSLNIQPIAVLKARDYVLVYEKAADIQNIEINRFYFDQVNLDPGGVIVTAKGDDCDFVSRFFTPQSTILEDPVTGSAHCSLIPFWNQQLGKTTFLARQLSARGGVLFCEYLDKQVRISGKARTYAIGTCWTV
jgi:PhzF family phenazine biosynthesis protein